MKKEHDFSKGVRGKFFRADAELNIPIYLELRIAEAVREHARKKSTSVGSLADEWLRKDLLSAGRARKLKAR